MSGENKFFFEEDVSSNGTGVSTGEQADLFGEAMSEMGIVSNLDSMAPKGVVLITNDVKEILNAVIKIEFGVVDRDYVVHITPTHPQRNLQDKKKLDAALRVVVIELNKIVPYDLRVDIHLPQEDWDIKVTSFVIREAGVAWNFDRVSVETQVIPVILEKLTEICVKL